MKTYLAKLVITSGLLFISAPLFGLDASTDISFPDHCNKMSKDPKCWESPRDYVCLNRNTCEVIEMVTIDNEGKFNCTAKSGLLFSCGDIVNALGTMDLSGVSVKVRIPYYDSCHLPGACGSKTCRPGFGHATLDYFCQ